MDDKHNNNDSIFPQNIQRGKHSGIIHISDDNSKITYSCFREYTTNFKNPEEKVRASYFVELVGIILEHYDELDTKYKNTIPLNKVFLPSVAK